MARKIRLTDEREKAPPAPEEKTVDLSGIRAQGAPIRRGSLFFPTLPTGSMQALQEELQQAARAATLSSPQTLRAFQQMGRALRQPFEQPSTVQNIQINQPTGIDTVEAERIRAAIEEAMQRQHRSRASMIVLDSLPMTASQRLVNPLLVRETREPVTRADFDSPEISIDTEARIDWNMPQYRFDEPEE